MSFAVSPQSWTYPTLERVTFGSPAAEAIVKDMERTGGARIFAITSPSVARTDWYAGVRSALGQRWAGAFATIRPHIPVDDVFAAAAAVKESGADTLLAIGGGSSIDAAKVVAICLGEGIGDAAGLKRFRGIAHVTDIAARPAGREPWRRTIAVPTTLSAAEFTWFGGALDPDDLEKYPYAHPFAIPRTVILDPAATRTAPDDLFLATGIKALDHAVERLSAGRCFEPLNDARCLKAIELLGAALPAIREAPTDDGARQAAQQGMALAMASPHTGSNVGASHAAGHAMGGHKQVQHGIGACVMLAPMTRWNAEVASVRQTGIAAALGTPGLSAGDAIEALVRRLGLPTRLRDIGIEREDLAPIAQKTLHNHSMAGNVRQPTDVGEILTVFEAAF